MLRETVNYAMEPRRRPPILALSSSLITLILFAVLLCVAVELLPCNWLMGAILTYVTVSLGIVGSILSAIAWVANRRGRYEIMAVAASLIYLMWFVAAFVFSGTNY